MLARLVGHAGITVLLQYLDVSISDLRTADRNHGTVEKILAERYVGNILQDKHARSDWAWIISVRPTWHS